MQTLSPSSRKKLIENKIIDIAYRIDDLPFPPTQESIMAWEKELLDLNTLLVEHEITLTDLLGD